MRETWIDRWKGLLIFLVVLGHVAGGGVNLWQGGDTSVLGVIREVVYAFHMPAFFLLAGMCWRTKGGWAEFLEKKAFRLLVPYFVFAVISWMVYDAVFGAWPGIGMQFLSVLHGGGWPNGAGFKCNSVLWFPPVMFVVLVAFRAMSGTSRFSHLSFLLPSCFVLWFLRAMCYHYRWLLELPWGLDLMLWYLPFSMIGNGVGGYLRTARPWKLGCLAVAMFVGIWLVRMNFPPHRLACLKGFAYAISLALAGSCLSLAVSRSTLWDKACLTWCGQMLAKLGVASMGIMLIHKFPVVALQERVGAVRRMFVADCANALVGMVFVTVTSASIAYFVTIAIRRHAPWMIGEKAKG